jgi:hypothetical protein
MGAAAAGRTGPRIRAAVGGVAFALAMTSVAATIRRILADR